MSKVYIVTRGEYSDYHIESVFNTKESAEKYCAVHWIDSEPPEIEEWDLEDGSNIECEKVYRAIHFSHDDRFDREPYYCYVLATTPFKLNIQRDMRKYLRPIIGIHGYIPVSNEVPRDVTLKIVRDHIAKFKAEEAGL